MRTLITALALAVSLTAQPTPELRGDFWSWGNVQIHRTAIPVIWNGEPAFITTEFRTGGWLMTGGGPLCEWRLHGVLADGIPQCAIGHRLQFWNADGATARTDQPLRTTGGPQFLTCNGYSAAGCDICTEREFDVYVGVDSEGYLVGCDPRWNPCRNAPGQNYPCGYFPRMVSAWLISLKVR